MTSDGMKQETQMPLDINLTLYFTLQEYDIVLVLHWVLLEPFGAFCVIPVCRLVVVVVDTVCSVTWKYATHTTTDLLSKCDP